MVATRLRRALIYGAVIAAAMSAFFILPIPGAKLVQIYLLGGSPLYAWRFASCHGDPRSFVMLQGIAPVFVYGAVLGYSVNVSCRDRWKWIAALGACLIGTLAIVLVLFTVLANVQRCGCPGATC